MRARGTLTRRFSGRRGSALSVRAVAPSVAELAGAVTDQLRGYLAHRRSGAAYIGTDYDGLIAALEDFVLRGGKRLRPAFAYWGYRAVTPNPGTASATRFCGCSPHWNCCTRVLWCMTTSSTTPPPAAHADCPRVLRRSASRPRLARVGRPVRPLGGDPAGRSVAGVGRRHRRGRGLPADGQRRVRRCGRISAPGARRSVPRHRRRVQRCAFDRIGDERQHLQDGVLHRVAAAAVGAAAAADRPDVQRLFHDLGTDLGVAFQLRDDVLGVFGDPAVTGKPSGDDLRSGKRTVLLAEAVERAERSDPAAAQLLRSSVGTDLTDIQVRELCLVIESVGALAAVEQHIGLLTRRALEALEHAPINAPARVGLTELAGLAANRSA